MKRRIVGRSRIELALILALGIRVTAGVANEEKILLQTGFEEGQGIAPAGWTADGGAQWSQFSHTGKRSIEIRSWKTDSEFQNVLDEYQVTTDPEKRLALVKVDPKKTWWISDPIEASGLPLKISFWGADNITYMNDESFRAEVGIVPCKPDGSPEDLSATRSGKLLHFYRTQRENYQLYAKCVPEGLRWSYRELVLKPAQGKCRVVLHFQKDPDGQVWVDDMVVSESARYRTAEATAVTAETSVKPALPLSMEINFPVSFNLFVKGDPLQSDLAIIGKDAAPEIRAGMTVAYEVRDFNYQWVAGGNVKLGHGPYPVWKGPDPLLHPKAAYLKTATAAARRLDGKTRLVPLELPEAINARDGQLLFLKAALYDGKTKLAEDEVAFGIIVPGVPQKENLWRGGKVAGAWGPAAPDLDKDYANPSRDYNGLYYKAGAQWNCVPIPYGYQNWPSAQPTKDGPIHIKESDKVYPNHGLLMNSYLLQLRAQGRCTPAWADDSSPESKARYGKEEFDKDGYAKFLVALVGAMNKQFPDATAICPTAGEVPFDQFRFDLQQASYRAIKTAFPKTEVGAWFWAGDVKSVLDKYQAAFDFFDTEMYADPHTVGMAGAVAAHACTAQLKRPVWSAIMEGCALSGSEEQPESARGVFDFHLLEWKYGNRIVSQFEFGEPYAQRDGSPLLRAAILAQFGGTGHMGGAKRIKMTRYDVMDGKNIRTSFPLTQYPQCEPEQYQPSVPTLALCNLIRFLDSARYERDVDSDDAEILQFERLDKTFLYLSSRSMADLNLELSGLSGQCESMDVFGQRYPLESVDGKLLVTIGHYPLILMFDSHLAKTAVSAKVAEDVRIAMTRPIVMQNPGEITVTLGGGSRASPVLVADPKLKAETKSISAGESFQIAVTPRETRPAGRYLTYVKLVAGNRTFGLLNLPLEFKEAGIDAELSGLPMTRTLNPALRVDLRNSTPKTAAVTVVFRDDATATTNQPAEIARTIQVPASGSANVDFPLNRDRVSLNLDYPMAVTLRMPNGAEREVRGTVHFRGVPKATQPIRVDGDLSDWPLDQLLPVEPNWAILVSGREGTFARRYAATWERQNNPAGKYKVYFQWNDNGLYMAAVVNNPIRSRPLKDPNEFYGQDCLFFTIYPDRYAPNSGTLMRPIKVHLSMDAAGKPVLVDINGVARDPKDIGAEYAARETSSGYVYEYFMSKKYLGSMKLGPGGGFSASLVAWATKSGPLMRNLSDSIPMYAFYRNCFDFDGGVQDMGRFVLTEK